MSNHSRIIKRAQGRAFARKGFDGLVYVEKEAANGFTALEIRAHGDHPLKRLTGDTARLYYVAEGSGIFSLDGETHEVRAGDIVTIMPESTYSYHGRMRLFEVNVSPTNSFTDEAITKAD